MKLWTLSVLVAALAGVGVGVGVTAWEPWDGPEVSSRFCAETKRWHAAMTPVLERVNEPESRSSVGLAATLDAFPDWIGAVPVADTEREIRAAVLETTRAYETWLSRLLNVVQLSATGQETALAFRESQNARIEAIDSLRRVNPMLAGYCGLPSLPITAPTDRGDTERSES